MAFTKSMHKKLLTQVQHEWEAELYYLSMMAWCLNNDYDGFGTWFQNHANEERVHGMKILKYLNEIDQDISIPSITLKPKKFTSVVQLFETALQHECQVTEWIHELVAQSVREKDFRTQNFLQWYVAEQVEEEAVVKTALTRVRRAGKDSAALLIIENELSAGLAGMNGADTTG
jgi:ferritin